MQYGADFVRILEINDKYRIVLLAGDVIHYSGKDYGMGNK